MQYSRQQLREYDHLFRAWCDAEKQACDAASALNHDELAGKPVSAERRAQVARLAMNARLLMVETLKFAPSTRRS
jgi:hypothetical protein